MPTLHRNLMLHNSFLILHFVSHCRAMIVESLSFRGSLGIAISHQFLICDSESPSALSYSVYIAKGICLATHFRQSVSLASCFPIVCLCLVCIHSQASAVL